MKKKKNKEKKKLNKYKLVIYNESTLNEKFNINLTKINVFTYFGLFTIVLTILIIILFIVTPLNNFLPRYHDTGIRKDIEKNIILMDSLSKEIVVRDLYFQNLKNILDGKDLDSIELHIDSTFKKSDGIVFTKTKHDSVLKELIAHEEELYLSMVSDEANNMGLQNMNFYKPVKGMVSAPFDRSKEHYGIDIVAPEDEPILATLSGTIILATWSVNTGYVIQIQHDNNLISVYKHNSELLKKSGQRVQAGESIAIIGNTGELSTGPHLHFELWHNGAPLDPAEYLIY